MLDKTLAARYANALYATALEARNAAHVLDDLRSVRDTIAAERTLKKTLYHPSIAASDKTEICRSIFGKSVTATTMHFLQVLFAAKRIVYLDPITEVFLNRCNQDNNRAVVKVTSAMPLPSDLHTRLREKITKLLGKEVMLEDEIDPRILGGVKLTLGGDVIDGSVAYKIQKLSVSMAGS